MAMGKEVVGGAHGDGECELHRYLSLIGMERPETC